MNFTESELTAMAARESARQMEISRVKWAIQSNDRFDSDHPDRIRGEIERLQRLLVAAGA